MPGAGLAGAHLLGTELAGADLQNADLRSADLRSANLERAQLQGARLSRVHQWDGKQWKVISDWYTADDSILVPLVKDVAGKYAAEKKLTPRDCSKES